MPLSVTINGTKVQAEHGMTVLEVAQANGIYIPTLCHSPGLRPAGACRMCVVNIEGMRGYPTACTTLVTDGMLVYTDMQDVQKLRREILSLILSEHPYTCLVCQSDCTDFQSTVRKAAVTTGCQYCPANGQCELQKLVDYLDLREIPYPITYRGLPVEQDDPFFDRDYNLCVLCGRCVRTCQETRHAGVLSFVKRGTEAIVGTAFGRSHLEMGCQFCGACVDVCPTGALADKRGKWEGVPTATVPSVCPYCSVGCAVDIQVKNNDKIIRVVGNTGGPANEGQLCVRGRFGVVDVVHSLSRLRAPMVRHNDRLIEASWEDALGVTAQHLSEYRLASSQDRDDRFALVVSAAASNEESYALQKFARVVMKSNNIALSAGFPEHDSASELPDTLKAIDGTTIRDLRNAACIISIGTNVFESHPILGLEILHALNRHADHSGKSASLIAIDARQTRLAQLANVWLQPNIATDHVLLTGMVKALTERDRIGNRRPLSPEDLRESADMEHEWGISDLDLDEVTAITGVKGEDIARAAQVLAECLSSHPRRDQPGSVVVLYGSGVTHYPTAKQVVTAIQNLAYLVNHVFGPGTVGLMGVPGEGNFVGACDMGVHPALLPGYGSVSATEARATFEAAWGVALNPTPGQTYQAILDGVRAGQIQALYLAGEMPPLSELSDLKFLLVQDMVSTEIMQYAHVVLPAATFAEMDGTMTNLEGRVQLLRQAISPFGSSRPGWMIARDIARHMGHRSWGYETASEVMDEVATVIPAYAGVNYKHLRPDGMLRQFEADIDAKHFAPIELGRARQLTSDQFPLTLITERNLFYYRGACLTEQVPGMNLIKQEETVYLNPKDISQLGVSDGDLVRVVSPYGSSECIVRAANGMLPEHTAFASFSRTSRSPLFPTLTPDTKAHAIRIELGP